MRRVQKAVEGASREVDRPFHINAGSVGHFGRSGQVAISPIHRLGANGVDHRPNGGRAVAGDGDVIENVISEDLGHQHSRGMNPPGCCRVLHLYRQECRARWLDALDRC